MTALAEEHGNGREPVTMPVERDHEASELSETDPKGAEADSVDEPDGITGSVEVPDGGADPAAATSSAGAATRRRGVLPFVVLPLLVVLLTAGIAVMKWQDSKVRVSELAGAEAVQAAKDTTIALLSYKAESAEKDLDAAVGRMTGSFRNDYKDLITKVVIPGAKQKHISATATVPAAAPVFATSDKAVVLLFIDQTTTIGADPPSNLQSTVRVTMNKVGGQWLMAEFTPV
jgi:Mce-associated membrane protein